MKYLLTILLFCSCSTTKTYLLDGSESKGNIVKWQWKVSGANYGDSVKTRVTAKKVTVELVVTDNLGRKDSATLKIR